MTLLDGRLGRLALGSLGAIAALACALALNGRPVADPARGAAVHDQPNIVLIQADDETLGQVDQRVMPNLTRHLINHGTEFTNYMVTTGQCCPSRASLITGQYAHNNGVTSNQVAYLGLKHKHNVLPVWLRRSGYRTMHVGAKYMNDYRAVVGSRNAPGWTRWWTSLSPTRYYKYAVSDQGRRRHFGQKPRDYITRTLGAEARRLIHKYGKARRPFYLQLDERAPHASPSKDPYGDCDGKPIPDPRDEGAFAGASLPEPPSFNEADMSDKPAFLRNAPSIGKRGVQRLTAKWRCALESLVGVDRNVGKVFDAVRKAGELNNTVFIYLSDNGLFYGEHRLIQGKVVPYGPAVHMPMVMRVPGRYRQGAPPGGSIGQLVGNIDIAPTLLDLAHAKPCARRHCRTMDGRSLMPLLDGKGHWPRGRTLLNEYKVRNLPRYSTCDFAAVRTRTEVYIEHYRVVNSNTRKCEPTLQTERYDLATDTYELNNLCYGGAPDSCPHDKVQNELDTRLRKLRRCAGIRGRDHRVAGRPFCDQRGPGRRSSGD